MGLGEDVEKEDGRIAVSETARTANGDDDTGSFRSRARSYSGDDARGEPSHHPGSTRFRRRSRSASLGRGRTPSKSSRISADGRERGRSSFDSRSRRRSRDSSCHPPKQNITFDHQTPFGGQSQGSAKRAIHLDRDQPGDWVINHHLGNLIIALDSPKLNSIRSALANFETMVRGIKDGKKPTLLPSSSSSPPSGDGKRFRINFAEVQRMRIRKLQCQLVRHVVEMRREGRESPGWEETLEQYIKALQDHDYMENRSKSIRDPFLATGEYAIDNYVLNCNIDKVLADDEKIKHATSLRPWEHFSPEQDNEPICGTRSNNVASTWYRGFKERVVIAAAGGALLVGPMWLMVLKGGLYASLISTTAFVAGFGLLMAYFLDEGKDVLGSTAAYAAVLVVFVGTSNA